MRKASCAHCSNWASVMVEDEEGNQHIFQIVGEDEADVNANKVSYVSPLAKALIKRFDSFAGVIAADPAKLAELSAPCYAATAWPTRTRSGNGTKGPPLLPMGR